MGRRSPQVVHRFPAVTLSALKLACAPVLSALALSLTFASSPALAVSVASSGIAYEYVASDNISWTDASFAAAAMQYSGINGHLVTIFNQTENDFVLGLLNGVIGSVWLGGSDAQSEGAWKWATGQQFWQGGTNGTAGPNVNYANWVSAIEPNNSGAGENYLSMYGASVSSGTYVLPGKWNDQVNSPAAGSDYYSIKGYVVQYDIVPVPLPAAAWLFGSGLLGLLGAARRSRR